MKLLFEDVNVIEEVFGDRKQSITEGLVKPDLNKPIFKMMPDKAKKIEDNKCPLCSSEIKEEDFKDASAKKEYSISGMCQKCQDEVSGK
jgi:hypothetical protein